MPNYILNRNVQMFLAAQTDPLILPGSISNSNFCLHTKVDVNAVNSVIKDPSVTGSRTGLPGQPGRRTGTWSVEMPMRGNGAAGVAPDCDPILQAAFGQAGVVVASTSVTYSLVDAIQTFALYQFRKDTAGLATNVTQMISMGSTVKDATFTLGPDIANFTASGDSVFVLDTDNFSNYLTAWKGGLSSMPTAPSAPTFNGLPVIGFTGSITADGHNMVELKSATIKMATGNEVVKDTFGTFIGSGVEGDERNISMSLVLDDSNDTSLQDLKQKVWSATPVDITIVAGVVAGNIWTFALKQVQITNAKFTDGNRRMRFEIGDSIAHGVVDHLKT